jgi:superfamily II DNA/RNA helicase
MTHVDSSGLLRDLITNPESPLHVDQQTDQGMRRAIAQIRAQATLRELADPTDRRRIASWHWSIHPDALARRAVALQAVILATAHIAGDEALGQKVKDAALIAARAWEGVAGLRDASAKFVPLMNAAIDYELAGYQANAVCLARSVERLDSVNNQPGLDFMASIFLQRKFIRFAQIAEPQSLLPSEAVHLTPYGSAKAPLDDLPDDALAAIAAHLLAVRGLLTAQRYFFSGDISALHDGVELLAHATNGYASVGDIAMSNLTSALTAVLPAMRHRSIWHWLKPVAPENALWIRYMKLPARGVGLNVVEARSISELWPSQITALENGLLRDTTSKVVRMPTGAGKTRVAELCIVHTLVNKPDSRCLYIAPFKALADEVSTSLEASLGDLGFGISAILGGPENTGLEAVLANEDHLLVLTPEKVDLLSRISPEIMAQVRLIILDEGHIIGDAQRGIAYEFLISRLHKLAPEARFLFLSAVVPNETLAEFSAWLQADTTIESTWRPAVQRLAKLEWQGQQGILRFSALSDEIAMEEFLPAVIRQREFRFINPTTQRQNTRRFPEPSNKAQVAAELAFVLVSTGPVLIFCPQPNLVEAVGKALQMRIKLSEQAEDRLPSAFTRSRHPSADVAAEWLGEEHLVTQLLRNSIAVHHGRLPDAVRSAIEDDFRAGRLKIVVATSTLAQGVNLPVRTVIIHSVYRHDEVENRQTRMHAREYWNIAGRAGRAGYETDGLTIHLTNNDKDERDFDFFSSTRTEVGRVQGALLSLLHQLVDERITVDDAGELLDASILPLLVEEAGSDLGQILAEIDRTLQTSFVAYQARTDQLPLDALLRASHEVATQIVERVPKTNSRRLFAATGLSSRSCLRINDAIGEHLSETTNSFLGLNSLDSMLELVISSLGQVPEMEPERAFVGNYAEVAKLWVSGRQLPNIVDYLQRESDLSVSPESLSEFLNDYVMYRLPWGASAFISIATDRLQIDPDRSPIWTRSLPALIKFGVPNHTAAWCMGLGISSRPLAIAVAKAYMADGGLNSPRDLRSWLGCQDAEHLAMRLSVTGRAVTDLGRVCQRARRVDVRATLAQGPVLPANITVALLNGEEVDAAISLVPDDAQVEVSRDYMSMVDRNRMIATVNDVIVAVVPPDFSQILAVEVDTGLHLSVNASIDRNTHTLVLNLRDASLTSTDS